MALLKLFAANDNKNLAEWEVTLVSAVNNTYTLRYRAPVAGQGSDGMHVGYTAEGNAKLLRESKPKYVNNVCASGRVHALTTVQEEHRVLAHAFRHHTRSFHYTFSVPT